MTTQSMTFYLDKPLVFAHRGARDVAPENTLAAFQAAMDADADGIELDVTRCASGQIVVIHDDSLDRTTDGSGAVADTPFAALCQMDAGSWFNPEFAGERIPTLEQVLELVGNRLRINIEIKGQSLRGNGIEADIAGLLHHHGLQESIIISSFNPAALWRMRKVAPRLKRGLLYSPELPIFLSRAWLRGPVKPDALHPHLKMVDHAYVARQHQRGYRVNTWTVNSEDDMQQMIALGLDGIITDHPARLRSLVGR